MTVATRMRIVPAAVITLAFLGADPRYAHAWWSVMLKDTSTHLKVGKAAMDLLSANEYPDLARYRDLGVLRPGGIQAWMSGPTDDENAHGKKYRDDAGKFDGGPIAAWLGIDEEHPDDGVLAQYKAFNFSGTSEYSAYYYLALMGHLVGDQAVPAHAANIFHVQPLKELPADPLWGDNFENYAYTDNFEPCGNCSGSIPTITGSPVLFYHSTKGLLDVTQASLPGWKDYRSTPYWVAHPEYAGDAFDERWGYYGLGIWSDDRYINILDDQNLIQGQLDVAVAYTAGVLRSVSMSLPPLVKDLSVTCGTLAPTFEAQINLTLMENRTPDVFVTLRAISASDGSDSYLLSVNGATWESHPVYLYDGDDLPFERDITATWKGSGRSEKTGKFVALPDGDYLLKVSVVDEDGNEVNAVFPTINSDGIWANDTARSFQIRTQPPDTPTGFVASGNDSSVKLSWIAPSTSLDGSALPDLAGYRLWRRDEDGSPCSGESSTIHGVLYCRVAGESTLSGTEKTYLDRNVTKGVTYTYVLQAVDLGGNVSPPTEGVAARPFPALWVPGEYASISQALAAARSGDVVMVRPGVYHEEKLNVGHGETSMSYNPENVVLMSERGPAFTVIESHAREFLIGAGDSTAIVGFTLRNDPAAYAAILCFFDDNVLVANNVFISNRIGVYAGGNQGVRVYNNTLVGNTTAVLVASAFGGIDVRNNIFVEDETAADIAGASGDASVQYNDFSNNDVDVVRHRSGYGGPYDDIVSQNYTFDPKFISYAPAFSAYSNFRLRPDSPGIDRGDPDLVLRRAENEWLASDLEWVDADGSRADLGAFGGPYTSFWATDDHDADGEPDTLDSDDDNDCLADNREDTNNDGIYQPGRETNPLDADTDDDGLTDGNCGSEDLNANGVWEPELGETDPRQADSDGDGIPDGAEKGLSAPEGMDTDLALYLPDLDPDTTTDPLNPDSDNDGLSDGVEDQNRNGRRDSGETDPNAADTDGDSFADGAEVGGGSDPLDAFSTPNHAPEIQITSVSQRRDGSGIAEIVFVGSDAEGDGCEMTSVEVSRDGVLWQRIEPQSADPQHTATGALSLATEGTSYAFVWDTRSELGTVEDHEVYARLQATDGMLVSGLVVSSAFVVDTVAPSLTVSAPAIANGSVSPSVAARDGIDAAPWIDATLDGTPWAGNDVKVEGMHLLSVRAGDQFGNVATAEARFTIDLTPPAISFYNVADGGRYGSAVSVRWDVRDAIDPAPAVTASVPSPHTFDTSGWHTIQVTAADAAGNAVARSCSFGIFRLEDLTLILDGLGIDAGLRRSLQAKVDNAMASRDRGNLNAAVNQLEAFIHAVDAQSGKKIAAADAAHLADFAQEVIALLQTSWSALALGEAMLDANDPALADPAGLAATLETNAVSRVILEMSRTDAPEGGFPDADGGLDSFVGEAGRRGIEVVLAMEAVTGEVDPDGPAHVSSVVGSASVLLDRHPSASGILMTNFEAAGRASAVTALVRAMSDAARERGFLLGLRVPCPSSDEELGVLAEARGIDLPALGALADMLYLDVDALVDANLDGIPDRDPTEVGNAVAFVGSLGLAAELVAVIPTADIPEPFEDSDMDGNRGAEEAFTDLDGDGTWGIALPQTPERIAATVSALPSDVISGVAVCRYSDTSAAEWAAFLNSNPR